MNPFQQILRQIQRLPVPVEALGLENELLLLDCDGIAGKPDEALRDIVENRLAAIEASLLNCPFIEPMENGALDAGDIRVMQTIGGQPVRISFANGRPNYATHLCVSGSSGGGKSCLLAVIASLAAAGCSTVIIDITKFFRNISALRRSHHFIRWEDLRINPFDDISGVQPSVIDHIMNSELAGNYGLQFGEYELSLATSAIRQRGTPNFPSLLARLEQQRYPGFSRRSQYRDSAVLIISRMLDTTSRLFRCKQGMNLDAIFSGNVVIEMDSLLPKDQAFLIRILFEALHLRAIAGLRRERPLLFIVDEAQVLVGQTNFSQKMLSLRHSAVHLLANFQNLSEVPVEFLGNVDALVSFQSTDERDRHAFASSARLTQEQKEHLGTLKPAEAVCCLPRSDWKEPFLVRVPRVEFDIVDDREIREASKKYAAAFNWTPLEQEVPQAVKSDEAGKAKDAEKTQVVRQSEVSGLDEKSELLLRDVLNQAHEFSVLGKRFERAGIRSAATQAAILRRLSADGYIKTWELAVGQGRPWKLVEPTEKAFSQFKVKWRTTRGVLPTRGTTQFVYEKIRKLDGWQCQREGQLEGKAVDLLCHDSGGRLVTVEIAGNPDHEGHNLVHCLKHGAVRHWVICTSQKVREAVEKQIRGLFGPAEQDKVKVIALSDALKDGWTP